MKDRPIIFSTPMVQSILAGRKTQTRRIIKPQPHNDSDFISKVPHYAELENHWNKWAITDEHGETFFVKCPYGEIGDILWVRESFDPTSGCFGSILYKADYSEHEIQSAPKGLFKWKPSIHMAKKFARIRLQIIDIRVQKLQNISPEEAIAEGIDFLPDGTYKNYYKGILIPSWPSAYHSFQSLWEQIHGSDSWDQNPWLWVIEFKVISKTGNLSNL